MCVVCVWVCVWVVWPQAARLSEALVKFSNLLPFTSSDPAYRSGSLCSRTVSHKTENLAFIHYLFYSPFFHSVFIYISRLQEKVWNFATVTDAK